MSGTYDVIMADCPSAEQAERDFDALMRLVHGKAVRTEGVIPVEHDGHLPPMPTATVGERAAGRA